MTDQKPHVKGLMSGVFRPPVCRYSRSSSGSPAGNEGVVDMESLTSGTLAGTGSFRCEQCGYVVTLAAADELPACPGCHGASFVRASLFAGGRFQRRSGEPPSAEVREALVTEAREQISTP